LADRLRDSKQLHDFRKESHTLAFECDWGRC
jgi:hypothetical protein